jgi:hypothetical protein
MAYAPVDRAAQLRRYADIIGKTVTPMNAPVTPYSNPNWARLAQGLVGAGFQGAAERAASREDVLNRGRSANLARALHGMPASAPALPAAAGPMSWLDNTLGFGAPAAAATPTFPVLNDDGTTNMEAVITAAGAANVDPLAAMSAATTLGTQTTATRQANNVRAIRAHLAGGGKVTDAKIKNLLGDLPTDISTLNTGRAVMENGIQVAVEVIDVFGRPTGQIKYAPKPLVDMGSKETAKLAARRKFEGTPAERKADEAFGTGLGKLRLAGGLADVEKNKQQLQDVVEQLRSIGTGKSTDNLTGLGVGMASLNRGVMAGTHPKALQALEQVEEVVQRNLRVILGAQFTEKEGTRLISRAYNPFLSEAANLTRLERLAKSMSRQLDAKMAAIAHFDKHGTLRGFEGEATDQKSTVDKLVEELTKVAPIPIEKWDDNYFDGFVDSKGKLTQEWNTLMKSQKNRARILKRMKELGRI